MRKTRIIMIGVPSLLGDLLESAIGKLPDMELVARKGEPEDVLDFVRRHSADVVIFRLPAERLPSVCSSLHRELPDLVVISITHEDRLMLLCDEASVEALIDLIRHKAQRVHT